MRNRNIILIPPPNKQLMAIYFLNIPFHFQEWPSITWWVHVAINFILCAAIPHFTFDYSNLALANSFEQEVPRFKALVRHPQLRPQRPAKTRPPRKTHLLLLQANNFVLTCFFITHLKGVRLAKEFETMVKSDNRFEIPAARHLGMVVFRLKGPNDLTEALLKKINTSGKLHCVPAALKVCRIAQKITTSFLVFHLSSVSN